MPVLVDAKLCGRDRQWQAVMIRMLGLRISAEHVEPRGRALVAERHDIRHLARVERGCRGVAAHDAESVDALLSSRARPRQVCERHAAPHAGDGRRRVAARTIPPPLAHRGCIRTRRLERQAVDPRPATRLALEGLQAGARDRQQRTGSERRHRPIGWHENCQRHGRAAIAHKHTQTAPLLATTLGRV